MGKRVADLLVETLQAAGVKTCYGIVGDTMNRIAHAIDRSEIDWVHVRHEEAGAFAAAAEGLFTGRLTACAGTCGPGSLHFINGLYEANRNRLRRAASPWSRLRPGQFYPNKATIIQIDIDPTHIGRRHPIAIGAVGNIKATLEVLLPRLKQHEDSAFLAAHVKLHQKDVAVARAESVSGPEAAISGTYLTKIIN